MLTRVDRIRPRLEDKVTRVTVGCMIAAGVKLSNEFTNHRTKTSGVSQSLLDCDCCVCDVKDGKDLLLQHGRYAE